MSVWCGGGGVDGFGGIKRGSSGGSPDSQLGKGRAAEVGHQWVRTWCVKQPPQLVRKVSPWRSAIDGTEMEGPHNGSQWVNPRWMDPRLMGPRWMDPPIGSPDGHPMDGSPMDPRSRLKCEVGTNNSDPPPRPKWHPL